MSLLLFSLLAAFRFLSPQLFGECARFFFRPFSADLLSSVQCSAVKHRDILALSLFGSFLALEGSFVPQFATKCFVQTSRTTSTKQSLPLKLRLFSGRSTKLSKSHVLIDYVGSRFTVGHFDIFKLHLFIYFRSLVVSGGGPM